MEKTAVDWTEWLVHRVLFWEEDDAKKGRILRTLHHAGTYILFTLIMVSHVLYPAFWFQTIILGFCSLVWIQHVLTHGCVISKVEQRLIKDESSFVDPYLEMFGIEADEKSKQGILILGSTLGVAILTLEWISRLSHKVIAILRSHLPVVSPVLHTLAA
jgi:hypothetical protein